MSVFQIRFNVKTDSMNVIMADIFMLQSDRQLAINTPPHAENEQTFSNGKRRVSNTCTTFMQLLSFNSYVLVSAPDHSLDSQSLHLTFQRVLRDGLVSVI